MAAKFNRELKYLLRGYVLNMNICTRSNVLFVVNCCFMLQTHTNSTIINNHNNQP